MPLDQESESSIVSSLFRYAYSHPTPLFVTFELTLLCNLRCVHCYNYDRSKPMPKAIKQQELLPAEIKRIIGELAQAGTLTLAFSGGEALLHPSLYDFIRTARTYHLAVRIKSNGMLLSAERVAALLDAGASDVDISMYGASAATHDGFTTQAGSFARTRAGVENANRLGLKPKISFILHQGNASEIVEMGELAEKLGVHHEFSTELTVRYDGSTGSTFHRLTESQLHEIYSGPLRGAVRGICNPEGDIRCACAKAVCGISSTGNVYPCIGAPIISGNLREKSFSEIWENSSELNRIRGLEMEDFKQCLGCRDRSFCQRSSGAMFANTGNYTGAEPWVCMEAATIHSVYEEVTASKN